MRENVRDDGWVERIYRSDTPAKEFGPFEPIVELWNSKRQSDFLPAWKDFSFEEFVGWHGWLCVFEIIETPRFDISVRLWGTGVAGLLAYDPTGKTLRVNDALPYEYIGGYEQVDIDFLEAVSRESAIGYGIGSVFWQNRDHVTYEELHIPLADDGKKVNKLLNTVNVLGLHPRT